MQYTLWLDTPGWNPLLTHNLKMLQTNNSTARQEHLYLVCCKAADFLLVPRIFNCHFLQYPCMAAMV